MKKRWSIALILVLAFSVFSGFGAVASDAEYVIGDFSDPDCNVAEWTTFKYAHKDNITDEVTRFGKTQSLRWTEMGDGTNRINSKLASPTTKNVGLILDYDYIYLWIYSAKANGQELNVVLSDITTNFNGLAVKVTMDYTGWKLHQVDIRNLTLSKFKNLNDATKPEPTQTDDWLLLLQCSGWNVAPLADTLLYMDEIFLSNTDYYAFSQTEPLSAGFPNGAIDVDATGSLTLSADRVFHPEPGYYDGLLTVRENGSELTEGYAAYFEHNKAYIQFDAGMKSGTEYSIELSPNAAMNDGTPIGDGASLTFTTALTELEMGDFVFTADSTGLSAPPASGTVEVLVCAKNSSEEAKNVVLIVGVFDKTTNQMKTMGASEDVILNPQDSNEFSAQVELDSYENCYIRAFLWDSTDGMYSYGEYSEI